MAAAAQTFQQIWRTSRLVQEIAAPHRLGHVRTTRGTGPNALIIVNLYGRPPVAFRPSQLRPL